MSSRMEEILAGAKSGFVADTRSRPGNGSPEVVRIPVGSIDPDPDNARKHFDQDELEALAENIRRVGQVQNAVVWHNSATGRYQLVAGERRLRACKLAGVATLVCLVLPRDLADETKREIAFSENMARSQLKPVEVARHWKSLMERWNVSGRELAARIGVAQSTVSKRLALLKLDADTQAAVDAGTVHKTKALAAKSTRRAGGRGPRGIHEFNSGVVKVKRGHTLEQLVAEATAALRQERRDNAAA